jgi:hypothetical protein
MDDVFISYSRKDRDFAARLHEALQARQRQAWMDLKNIPPTAKWREKIKAGIEGARAFVFVLSPDSMASPECLKEVEHAAASHKRLIPVVCREVEAKAVPEALGKLNWIFLRDQDNFDKGIDTLLSAVDTDLEWVDAHTNLLEKATEWDKKTRDQSLLLRGGELKEAEAWQVKSAGKEPKPTELMASFIVTSRQGETRRQRKVLVGVSVGFVVVLVLAILAIYQWLRAETELATARAQNLAAQAQIAYTEALKPGELFTPDPQRSALLALESLNIHPNIEADQVLRSSLRKLLPQPLEIPVGPDEELLEIGPQAAWISLKNPETGEVREVFPQGQTNAGLLAEGAGSQEPPPAPAGQAARKARQDILDKSLDGKLYLKMNGMTNVVIFRTADHAKLVDLPHEWNLRFAAFSPDSRWLVTITPIVSRDPAEPRATFLVGNTVRVWEVATGRKVTEISLAKEGDIAQFSLSPEGDWLGTTVDTWLGTTVVTQKNRIILLWPLWPDLLRAEVCKRLTRNLSESEWRNFIPYKRPGETCPNLPVISE